jgi:sugar phosphate permease
LFYGWWIVIIGCIQDAVKGGTFNTGFTLYFLPILTELHLSRAATSLPFSLARLEAALEGPLVGYLIDRFDPRVMMVLGVMLAGLGFVLLAFVHSYLFFLLVFMGLLTLGFQAGFNHASMAVINHWFLKRRGLAMAFVQTGQAIGGVVLFPLVALAVLKLGWRPAAFLSGLVVLMLMPLVLLVRRSPESMGLLPDGETRAPHHPSSVTVRPVHLSGDTEEFTTREAMRTPAFWLLAAFHGMRNIPYAGVSVHLVPLLVWKGLNEPTAAFFVGLMAFSTVIIRPLTGWLGDRWSKQKIGAMGILLGSLGLVVLAYSEGGFWPMVAFVVLFS